MALFPPLVADVLLILTGVISIVALVSAAYGWSIIINGRKEVDKIVMLEDELKKTQRHDADTGSPEAQVALITRQIEELSNHLRKHKKAMCRKKRNTLLNSSPDIDILL